MLETLFRKDPVRSQAETLYAAIADQARSPGFYTVARAPDTPQGRFDMLALHMFLALERLRVDAPATDRLTRLLQEIFFQSLDSALREMGVGDLSVGRRIRGLAESFYGRFSAYERAADADALAAAIARNVLGTDDAAAGRPLAVYAAEARDRLQGAAIEDLAVAVSQLAALSAQRFSKDRS